MAAYTELKMEAISVAYRKATEMMNIATDKSRTAPDRADALACLDKITEFLTAAGQGVK